MFFIHSFNIVHQFRSMCEKLEKKLKKLMKFYVKKIIKEKKRSRKQEHSFETMKRKKKKEKRLSSKLTLDYIGNCTGLLLCTVLCCFTLDPSGIFTSHNYKGNTTTKFKQKQATN